MKALEILKKILKEINDDNLFLSEDFISNIDIRLSIMELERIHDIIYEKDKAIQELEELQNKSCENCKKGFDCPILRKLWKEKLRKEGSQGFLNSYKNYRKSEVSEKEWKHQYQQEFLGVEETSNFKDTKRNNRKEKCGDCTFFGDKGCTTSHIEAKWGNRNTPACSEFSPKIFGTKVTLTIMDDIEIIKDNHEKTRII